MQMAAVNTPVLTVMAALSAVVILAMNSRMMALCVKVYTYTHNMYRVWVATPTRYQCLFQPRVVILCWRLHRVGALNAINRLWVECVHSNATRDTH